MSHTPAGVEKGHASYDISMVLTRHATFGTVCARVLDLRRTAGKGRPGVARLESALKTACTCGAGDSDSERTSVQA